MEETLVHQLNREQKAEQRGLAGQKHEEDMMKQQQLDAIIELLMQNTPPADILQAGYDPELVKLAIQMIAREERAMAQTDQDTLGIGVTMPEEIPINESLAGGNVVM